MSYRDRESRDRDRRDRSPPRSRRDSPRRERSSRDRSPDRDRRREDSPRRSSRRNDSPGRRRRNSPASDGIHVEDFRSRRRDDRDRRDDRRDDRDRGGRSDEERMKKIIRAVFREYLNMYHMMLDETQSIRKFDFMRYASKSIKELDRGDASIYTRELDDTGRKSPLEMMQTFEETTLNVKEFMNKQYREVFFDQDRNKIVKTGLWSSSERKGRDTQGGRYRDEERGGGDRYRDRKDDRRYDEDRGGRRSDRREDDRYGRDKGDRYDDRRDDRRRDDRREDRYRSSRDSGSGRYRDRGV